LALQLSLQNCRTLVPQGHTSQSTFFVRVRRQVIRGGDSHGHGETQENRAHYLEVCSVFRARVSTTSQGWKHLGSSTAVLCCLCTKRIM
jgi:hypothetical protein